MPTIVIAVLGEACCEARIIGRPELGVVVADSAHKAIGMLVCKNPELFNAEIDSRTDPFIEE